MMSYLCGREKSLPFLVFAYLMLTTSLQQAGRRGSIYRAEELKEDTDSRRSRHDERLNPIPSLTL